MNFSSKSEDGNGGDESYFSSSVFSTSSSSSTCSTSSDSSAFTSLSGALQGVSTDDIHSNSNLLRVTRSWAYYLDGRRRYQYQPHRNDRGSCQPNIGHSQSSHRPSGETDRSKSNVPIDDEDGIKHNHNHCSQYSTSLDHVAEDSLSRPALEEIKLHGVTGVKRVFGVAFFLGLIPILGPILYTCLIYHKVYRPLLSIKIGRISRTELQQTMQIYLFLDLMLGLSLPIIGPVLRAAYLQPALRMTDKAKAKVLEHGEVCVRAYNQVAALIGYTSEPRSLLSSLERISIQTLPPTLPRLLSRSSPLTRHRRRPRVRPYTGGPRIIHRLPGNIVGSQRHQLSIRQPAQTLNRSTVTFSGRGTTPSLSHVTFSSTEFGYHYQHDHNPHFPYHFHEGNRVDYLGTESCATRSYSSLGSALEVEKSSVRSPYFSFLGSSEVADEKEALSLEDVSKLVPACPKLSTEHVMPSTLPLLHIRNSAMPSLVLSQSRLSLILPIPQDASEPHLKSTSTTQVVVSCGDPVLAEETIPEVVTVPLSENSPQGTELLITSAFSSLSAQPIVPLPLSSSSESLSPRSQQSLSGCDPSHEYKLYLMGHNYPLDWFKDEQGNREQDQGSVLAVTSSCQVQQDHGSSRDSTHYSSSDERVVKVSVQDKHDCEIEEDMNEMTLSLPVVLVGGTQAPPSNGVPSSAPGYSQLRRSPGMDFSTLRQQRATAIESIEQAYQRRVQTSSD